MHNAKYSVSLGYKTLREGIFMKNVFCVTHIVYDVTLSGKQIRKYVYVTISQRTQLFAAIYRLFQNKMVVINENMSLLL